VRGVRASEREGERHGRALAAAPRALAAELTARVTQTRPVPTHKQDTNLGPTPGGQVAALCPSLARLTMHFRSQAAARLVASAPLGQEVGARLSEWADSLASAGKLDATSMGTNATMTGKANSTQENGSDSNELVPPYMQQMTTVLVVLHLSVFVSGLVGNALVCLSVYRNKSLQTVTNYYIVNLAVADFLVILICLPPTVYWDLTLTWNFGLVSCKLVLYLQVSQFALRIQSRWPKPRAAPRACGRAAGIINWRG